MAYELEDEILICIEPNDDAEKYGDYDLGKNEYNLEIRTGAKTGLDNESADLLDNGFKFSLG